MQPGVGFGGPWSNLGVPGGIPGVTEVMIEGKGPRGGGRG